MNVERCANAFTGRLVSQSGIPDAVYAEAHAEFSDKDLVDLTLIISLMNALNRMAISFRHVPALRT